MDLELSQEEAELRDNVRSVLAGICPPPVVRSVYENAGAPMQVWAQMVDLGWPSLCIEEEHGGLGLGAVELALVAEELGRAVAPGPLLATISQFGPVIREAGSAEARKQLLGAVAAGAITGTAAWCEDGRWDLDAVETAARRDGDGWVLHGGKASVVDGCSADEIAVVARSDHGLGVFVVPQEAVRSTPRVTLDPTLPVADVVLEDVYVDGVRVIAEPGTPGVPAALERAAQEAVLALAASTVGASRMIFETTVEYAKNREQYGRPIGSFQAIKHRLVDAYLAVERATALVYYAAATIAEDAPDRAEVTAAAKAAAGDCQRLLAQEGLQLHGGIGFTWEHDLHFLLKRAKVGDTLFGGAVAQRDVLAGLLGIRQAALP